MFLIFHITSFKYGDKASLKYILELIPRVASYLTSFCHMLQTVPLAEPWRWLVVI